MEKPIKILSVEDDEFMRIFLKDVFWLHGISNNFQFNVVENIKKAEDCVANPETKPDLIFLDVVLPDHIGGTLDKEGGLRFLQELKSNPETKNIKVVIFSAYGDKEIKEKALKLGAEKYLLKGENLPQDLIRIAQELSR